MQHFPRNLHQAFLAGIVVLGVSLSGCAGSAPRSTDLVNAVLWTQTAPEHDAACVVAYRAARTQLDLALQDNRWTAALEQTGSTSGLPPAVIVDVDETVLDNAAYEARLVRDGAEYGDATYSKWCEERKATAIPGAADFCRYATEKGVSIFYITNRKEGLKKATEDNLKSVGLPVPDRLNPVRPPAPKVSDKGPRRAEIAKEYRVLLLIGDNLADFVSVKDGSTSDERMALARQHADRWGKQWIMLPNPMYGDWERAAVPSGTKPEERSALKRKALRP